MNRINQPFAFDGNLEWEPAGEGIRRKILTYNAEVMMVRVAFEKGAVGAAHSHPHIQCSLVEQGVFDITIAGRTERLQAGRQLPRAAERHSRGSSRGGRRASRCVHAHARGFRRPQALDETQSLTTGHINRDLLPISVPTGAWDIRLPGLYSVA